MTVFLLLVLGLATAVLWTRADRLDRRLRVIEPRLDMLEWAQRQQAEARQQAERRDQAETPVQEFTPAETEVPEPEVPEPDDAPPAVEAQPEPQPEPPTASDSEPTDARPRLIPAMRAPEETVSAAAEEPADDGAELPAEATPEPVETTTEYRAPRFDFEDLFGRLLPIWAGGVALAVAGFFLVRYSIEQGLLGPSVRTALGFLFGTGLLAGAEVAYRQEHRLADPRVRQALAGAGIATLYASFYMAGTMYGLIGPGLAFVGLAAVTAAAIALSFRFGLPSAILGLVGGFAAPVLVSSDEANLPLLALYLALVTGGLSFAGDRQGRSWLGLAALAGGLGWGVLMLLGGVTGTTDILALGGYIVLLGAVIPAFTGGPEAPPVLRAIIAGIAALQMAAMVSIAGYDPTAWSLYLLLAAALAFFAWREPRMREANGFTALLSLWMLGLWNDPPTGGFALVVAGLTALFALLPLVHVWRRSERWSDIAQLVVMPLGLALIAGVQFHFDLDEYGRAALALGFGLIPAAATALRWKPNDESLGYDALVPLAPAAILATAAGWCVVPLWAAVFPPAIVACVLLLLGFRREQLGLSAQAWAAFGASVIAFAIGSTGDGEIMRLAEWQPAQFDGREVLRWLALLATPLLFALRRAQTPSRMMGEIVAVAVFYGLAAQVLPGQALAWLMAATAVALALLPEKRLPGAFTALAIAAGWAIEPLAKWIMHAGQSLTGEAMMIAEVIGWQELGLMILPVMLALGVLARTRFEEDSDARVPLQLGFGVLAIVAFHIVFKQLFAIATPQQFVAYGLAERTVWEALLLGVAVALWKLSEREASLRVASGFVAGASLAHFTVYSLALHNPMLVAQAVGPWPLANLLLPSFGVALGGIALLRHLGAAHGKPLQRLCDGVSMVLIVLLSLGLLRQGFAGSILLDPPVGQTEDLLRSLLGIVLAIGFLGWGAYRDSRTWRIGSLVVALVAVLKVFLFDAAGLEGLARIASFMALGFSLIGIGWFYTRQLRRTNPQSAEIPS